jgi:putative Mn2+ efflux pump MntP
MVTINLFLVPPLAALIGGILILLAPRHLNYIVAVYLIIVGIAGLWPHFVR